MAPISMLTPRITRYLTTNPLHRITAIHTLGPEGTNCEAAAGQWFARLRHKGKVRLHRTLEEAVPEVGRSRNAALMACAAYPQLHELVFANLSWLDMADSLLMPTHPMVLARRPGRDLMVVATHPAPQGLVPKSAERLIVTSNAQAAIACAEGLADGCITTWPAAMARGLEIMRDFGSVSMAFTVHVHRDLFNPLAEP